MLAAADYIGMVNAERERNQAERDVSSTGLEATFILGGQIGTEGPATFLLYPQGTYIDESAEHPFFQIGEIQYGKPILDRVIGPDLSLEAAGRCARVSMNSTLRSNVSVGGPVELLLYRTGSLAKGQRLYLSEDDPFFRSIGERWNEGLLQARNSLPPLPWEGRMDEGKVCPLYPSP
jgi:putative proteasome-type protease